MTKLEAFKELFRIHKLKNYRKTRVGFGNIFWRIVRDTKNKSYTYYFRDFAGMEYRQLHSGIKVKFLSPCFITFFCVIFNLFWIPFIVISFIPYCYFEGGKNWITDSAWENNVRFFNWVNIILVVVLALVLILK